MKQIRFNIRFLFTATFVVAVLVLLWQQHRQLNQAEAALTRHWFAEDTVLPDDSYRLLKHFLVDSPKVCVERVVLETNGRKNVELLKLNSPTTQETIRITSHGNRYDFGIHRVEMTFVAIRAKFKGEDKVTVTATIKAGDEQVTHEWSALVPKRKSMKDILTFGYDDGIIPQTHQDELLRLDGKPLMISVK